jgi:HSP20 family molecular chaperone IbpA
MTLGSIDAYRTESGLVVRVELPGMRPEDVEVPVSEGMLTISGEKGTA